MSELTRKRVLVGVTGGIAAYKSPDLVRRLRERGAEVRVAMTRNATRFITPLSLQAVSGAPVRLELLDEQAESGMGHIELARWAQAIIIAPATAGFLARLAHGFADDLLATICIATEAPITVAPAMNRVMWNNPATTDNLAVLARRGIRCVGPDSGDQACGESGPGRMLAPEAIVELLDANRARGVLTGTNVLVTAGPTWEALDPVRGLTNHSSGKMGYAVADAAAEAGAVVCLVSGPTALTIPRAVTGVAVESAQDMYDAVHERVGDCDIFVAVAAVADYRPSAAAKQKIKKDAETVTLELVRNPDILASVAALDNRPFTVGFAAETHDVAQYARGKLAAKNLDLIAANHVGGSRGGFGSDENTLCVIDRDGSVDLGPAPKHTLATALIEHIARRFHASHSSEDPRPTAA